MRIRNFKAEKDLDRLEAFLRNRYYESHNTVSWLPERLHDLLYRVSALEEDEQREKSMDYVFLWEENEEIVACILPDGDNIYLSIRNGFEQILPSMIAFGERNCLPLFAKADNGTVKLWFAISDSLTYAQKTLTELGYKKYAEEEYANCIYPMKTNAAVELPCGYRFLYGEEYPDEINKWTALRMGFHPDYETTDYVVSMNPYIRRKKSSLYKDSFECIVAYENSAEKNNVCAYCFVYIDKPTKTALIEPVSTREKYRHKGIGTALLHGAVKRCKTLGIEKCYVNSFGWRKDFYISAGFLTESSVGFWYKEL